MAGKGAAPAVISALPTYKYKLGEGSEAGGPGLLWAGTEKERAVAGEDAVRGGEWGGRKGEGVVVGGDGGENSCQEGRWDTHGRDKQQSDKR